MPRLSRSIRDGLLGLAYPEECRVCGGTVESWDDGVACSECWTDPGVTKLLNGPVCAKCGTPVSSALGNAQSPSQNPEPRLCGTCIELPFAAARACGVYSGALEASILFLKSTPHICPRLRGLICRSYTDHYRASATDLVIPVPLHRLRERQRGFNQASIIARLISREFDFQLDERSLVRTKPTERHRAGMDATDRAQSVERAFEVARPRLLEGATVLLVDDLYTTGSTLCAAAKCLVEAGARQVNVLTVARVVARAIGLRDTPPTPVV